MLDDLWATKNKMGYKRSDAVTWLTFSQSHEDKRVPIPATIHSGTPTRWRGWKYAERTESKRKEKKAEEEESRRKNNTQQKQETKSRSEVMQKR